jgi:hypothetical protein
MPTYTYPYKTLNPIFEDPTQVDTIEKFDNIIKEEEYNATSKRIFFMMLILFIFLIYTYM